jgi:D-alanine-D-alanine ligase-like ATP-grasp enzyme
VQYLEERKLPFTGAGSNFYINSTSKTILKRLMLNASVPTLPFVVLRPNTLDEDFERVEDVVVGYPLIIKPSISYGSMMISTSSVVDSSKQARFYLQSLDKSYTDEIFAEAFLAGTHISLILIQVENTLFFVLAMKRLEWSSTLQQKEYLLHISLRGKRS